VVDSRSEARVAQASASWTAVKLLSSNPCVLGVMVLAEDGKLMAHEKAPGCGGRVFPIDGGFTFICQSPDSGLVFYIRTTEDPTDAGLPAQIEAATRSPLPVIRKASKRERKVTG